MSKTTGQAPSEILRLHRWASEQLGGLDDIWTPYQFNNAVSALGNTVESLLAEVDKATHRPRYTLEQLVGKPRKVTAQEFKAMFGSAVAVRSR